MSQEEKPNRILVRESVGREYVIRLSRDIREADDFEEEFQVLAGAGPQDTVKLIINSDGGNIATALLLIKAIRECEAHTIAYIGFMCASAATIITLACDEYEMDEWSSFMIHTATWGVYGKAQEVKSQVAHMIPKLEAMVRVMYAGFLNEAEIEQVIIGQDLWFSGEELAARLTSYMQHQIEQEELDTDENDE